MSLEQLVIVTPEQKATVLAEYEKTPEELAELVIMLRSWLKTQAHLPDDFETRYLEIFLKGSKFSLEKCKTSLDAFFTNKTLLPEIFEKRVPFNPSIQRAQKFIAVVPLPRLTKDLSRVHILRLMSNDVGEMAVLDLFRQSSMVEDLRTCFDYCRSHVFIYDISHITLDHIGRMSPFFLKKLTDLSKKCMMEKIKEIHFVNVPGFAMALINFMTSMQSDKMRSRVHFHKGHASLHKFISKDVLPLDYGGDEICIEGLRDEWKELMESYNDWYVKDLERKSNETLRVGSTKTNDMFGIEGSFRKLNFD